MSGTTFSQIIPIVATVFIARLYSSEEFGEIELFLKLSTFLIVVSTLRYELAIPLPKLDSHAFYLFHFSMRWNVIFLVLSQLLITLAYFFLNPFLGTYAFSHFYLLLPGFVFLSSFMLQAENWSLRFERFTLLSWSKVGNAFANNLSKIGFGLMSFGPIGLIFGNIIGGLIGGLIYLPSTIKAYKTNPTLNKKPQRLVSARIFRDFPFVNAPHAIADALKEIAVVLLFTHYFGIDIVGYYYFALKIIRIPISLVGMAFAQVFYSKAAKIISEKDSLKAYVGKNIRDLFLISIVPAGILFFFGEQIFTIAFGNEWRFAGRLAEINAPVLLVIFISSPLSRIPMLLGAQRQFFVISFVNYFLILLMILLGALVFAFDFEQLWISLTILQFTVLGTIVAWYYSIVLKYEAKL